jgi:hypothetical protein
MATNIDVGGCTWTNFGVMAAPNIVCGTVPAEILPLNMGWLRAQPRTVGGGYIRFLDADPPNGVYGTYTLRVPFHAGGHRLLWSFWRVTDAPTYGTFTVTLYDGVGAVCSFNNSVKVNMAGSYDYLAAVDEWKDFKLYVHPIGGTAEFTFWLGLLEHYPVAY